MTPRQELLVRALEDRSLEEAFETIDRILRRRHALETARAARDGETIEFPDDLARAHAALVDISEVVGEAFIESLDEEEEHTPCSSPT